MYLIIHIYIYVYTTERTSHLLVEVHLQQGEFHGLAKLLLYITYTYVHKNIYISTYKSLYINIIIGLVYSL